MKRVIVSVFVMGATLLTSSCATRNAARPAYAPTDHASTASTVVSWPLVFDSGAATYTIFEPQCDSWDGHQLMARSAVAVQSSGESQPIYGVISFSAITLVDKTSRLATLADVKISSADFPSARGQTPTFMTTLCQEFPVRAQPLSLDQLEASLTPAEPIAKAESLNNTPPKIIIATRPAVLVSLDGPPAWRPVEGTRLERVINTRILLLKDSNGRCYLHLFEGYLQASSLDGPWTVASQGPTGAETAEKLAMESGQEDLLTGEPDATTHQTPSLHASLTPDVFVTTVPTELITLSGQPTYQSIPGTDLLYAANTSGNVFKSLTDQQNYILISGRWYKASSLSGPWQFVPSTDLPRDFANIPDANPKENVKASVPGTQQAEEALIANSIPQSAAVSRASQMPSPQLDGAMQLAPIEGTPLHYVVNSATPIIEVDPHSWYACQNGVWYASASANGLWAAAASVPAVIYTIPTSSPLHCLTYVQVYGATPNEVYEGYTPGYLGTEVSGDNTVVYGTGYNYPPWIGTAWYGPPCTWGCGFDDCWTPWWGWGFDYGFGWGCGFGVFDRWDCGPPHPWWGGFRHGFDHDCDRWKDGDRGGRANTGANFYHHPGESGGNRFNGGDGRGRAGYYGRAYNSRTGQLAAGQRAQVQAVSGSAWRPANGPGLGRNSFVGGFNRGGLPNGNRVFAGSREANPSRSWAWPWTTPVNPGTRPGNYTPPMPGRSYGGLGSRVGGFNRSFQNYSFGGSRGGYARGASPGGGGAIHSAGGSFRSAGGGGFRGGGGHVGGGFSGGGGHGGGGFGGGGGHGGGGGGGRR